MVLRNKGRVPVNKRRLRMTVINQQLSCFIRFSYANLIIQASIELIIDNHVTKINPFLPKLTINNYRKLSLNIFFQILQIYLKSGFSFWKRSKNTIRFNHLRIEWLSTLFQVFPVCYNNTVCKRLLCTISGIFWQWLLIFKITDRRCSLV